MAWGAVRVLGLACEGAGAFLLVAAALAAKVCFFFFGRGLHTATNHSYGAVFSICYAAMRLWGYAAMGAL